MSKSGPVAQARPKAERTLKRAKRADALTLQRGRRPSGLSYAPASAKRERTVIQGLGAAVVVNATLVAGLVGFVPALFILYLVLDRFEKYFLMNRLMLALGIGIVTGAVVAMSRVWFWPQMYIAVILVAFLGCVIKQAVLLSFLYRSKFDTPFYAAAMGAGSGMMMAMASVYATFNDPANELSNVGLMVALLAYAVVAVLSEMSTTILIGYGSAKGKPWEYFAYAVLLQIVFGLILIPFWLAAEVLYYVSICCALILGIASLWYLYSRILPDTIPRELKRRMEKEERRARRQRREGGSRQE